LTPFASTSPDENEDEDEDEKNEEFDEDGIETNSFTTSTKVILSATMTEQGFELKYVSGFCLPIVCALLYFTLTIILRPLSTFISFKNL
jgi:hypothetical protein